MNTTLFGLIDCTDSNHCIELLFYITLSLSALVLILIIITAIFMCLMTIQNSRSNKSGKELCLTDHNNQCAREFHRPSTRHIRTRSSSISLASETEENDDYNKFDNELNSQNQWV